jgi:hypothetical protein
MDSFNRSCATLSETVQYFGRASIFKWIHHNLPDGMVRKPTLWESHIANYIKPIYSDIGERYRFYFDAIWLRGMASIFLWELQLCLNIRNTWGEGRTDSRWICWNSSDYKTTRTSPLQGARYSNRISILNSVQRSSDKVDHNCRSFFGGLYHIRTLSHNNSATTSITEE